MSMMRRWFVMGAALISGAGGGCRGCEETPGGSPPATDATAVTAQAVVDGGASDGGETVRLPSGTERDPTGVRRCCLAIGRNVAGAPSEHKAAWQAAFDACNQAAEGDAGRAGLEPVRQALKELGWPAACQ
ncbi:hypothetical protein [Polyangium aurulentum]|uniref:hypothetical protein n=1 Tax=Polyangium aurulentum TaxID=2567896 RepID=UPI0010AE8934|nr:hypothetical protein [Polyangium aurulentum]UQA55707.1 hypothetical protein E8A73_030785 [Polyangium aurulentum]